MMCVLATLVVLAGADALRQGAMAAPVDAITTTHVMSSPQVASAAGWPSHAMEPAHCGLAGLGRAAKRACAPRPVKPAIGLAAAIRSFGSARAVDLACHPAPPAGLTAAIGLGLPAAALDAGLANETCDKPIRTHLVGDAGDDDPAELTADDEWPDLVPHHVALAPVFGGATERMLHFAPAAPDPAAASALPRKLDRPPNGPAPAFPRA